MLRCATVLSGLLVLAISMPAQAARETAEGFSKAMQGCWNQVSWSQVIQERRANDPGYSMGSQMCLEGELEGELKIMECSGAYDLVECSQTTGRYVFREQKFWRSYSDGALAGASDSCDVFLQSRTQFTLKNCAWAIVPAFGQTLQDTVFERIAGQ
jgi:hypothetical protein